MSSSQILWKKKKIQQNGYLVILSKRGLIAKLLRWINFNIANTWRQEENNWQYLFPSSLIRLTISVKFQTVFLRKKEIHYIL